MSSPLPLIHLRDEMDGLPVEGFYTALQAEGLREVDRPGSTRPLNQLPQFQHPVPLFPHDRNLDRVNYRVGQFPIAEQVHHHTPKLPVWHCKEDLPVVEGYIEASVR